MCNFRLQWMKPAPGIFADSAVLMVNDKPQGIMGDSGCDMATGNLNYSPAYFRLNAFRSNIISIGVVDNQWNCIILSTSQILLEKDF